MAILNIVFCSIGPGHPTLNADTVTAEVIDISETSASSTNTCSITHDHVRLVTDTNCWLAFGTDPVAVNNEGILLIANASETFCINQGDKIAAVTAT